MVSALDFGSGGPGSSPGGGHCVVLRQDTLLSSLRCANGHVLGVTCDGLASHPGGELSTGPMGHLGPYKGFIFYF